MTKKTSNFNIELESSLSEFISQISGKNEESAKLIASKFLNQIEGKLNFEKKAIESIFSELTDVEHNQPIYVNEIPFISFCEHHMFPFFGHVSIAVLPKKDIIGISKFSDLVNNLSSNLTLQEKFTEEISQLIYSNLDCEGVHVKIKAKHLCSDLLSPENAIGDITTTFSTGIYELDSSLRAEASLNMS